MLPTTTKYHAELRITESQLMVKMPPVAGLNQDGFVHVYEIKTIDFRERGAQFIGKVDDDFLIEIMDRALRSSTRAQQHEWAALWAKVCL